MQASSATDAQMLHTMAARKKPNICLRMHYLQHSDGEFVHHHGGPGSARHHGPVHLDEDLSESIKTRGLYINFSSFN